MSSTKIVIIVLVLVGLLFIIFVARGALRNEAPPPKGKNLGSSAKKTEAPDWTKTVKGLFSSLQPKVKLKQTTYSAPAEEPIAPDAKHPFRTVTFHWLSGRAEITYKDNTPLESGSPLKDMDNPQRCTLKQVDSDVRDKERCSILALKGGGTLTFACKDNAACRVEVE
jgi:hypothetical protein